VSGWATGRASGL